MAQTQPRKSDCRVPLAQSRIHRASGETWLVHTRLADMRLIVVSVPSRAMRTITHADWLDGSKWSEPQ